MYLIIVLLLFLPMTDSYAEDSFSEIEPVQMTLITRKSVGDVAVALAGSGKAVINWGDWGEGVEETIILSDSLSLYTHTYVCDYNFYTGYLNSKMPHTITITGNHIMKLACGKNQIAGERLNVHPDYLHEALFNEGNQLISVDVSSNRLLEYFDCCFNYIKTLNIGNNPLLEYLDCSGNDIRSLNVSKNIALKHLNCDRNIFYDNPLLDVSENLFLEYLSCNANHLENLELSRNTVLKYLSCNGNWKISKLDISKNTLLEFLDCSNNILEKIDTSKNRALKVLYCSRNLFTDLDVRENIYLEYLDCFSNRLTNLDVHKNKSLKYLYCYENQLTGLDVSRNHLLIELYCYNNQIKNLNVGEKPFLTELICQRNQLGFLDVIGCNSLMKLDCGYNLFSCTALNYLFETLHSNSLPEEKIIDLGYDNPIICDFSLPHSKGWSVYPFDEYGEYEEDEEIEGDE